MLDHSDENWRWEGQVADFQLSASCAELLGTDEEPIEFEWNISQDLHHCRFFKGSRVICEEGILNQKNLEIVSSSCQCSMTSIGQRREKKRIVFQIQTKSRCTRRDSRKDIVRSSVVETKRSGMGTATANLMENGIPLLRRWYKDSEKQVTQSLQVLVH